MSGNAFMIVWLLCAAGLFGWLLYQGQVGGEVLPVAVGCAVAGLVPPTLLAAAL